MITELDEAIKHCKEVAEKLRDDAESRFYDEDSCLACADEHEQLAEWLTELQERREADRWNVIYSKEDLPKESGKCLVSLDFGDVNIDFYDKDWGFVCYVGNVIAWKPLPKPYTESEDT